MIQRAPYQLFIVDNGQQHPEIEGIENQLASKYQGVGVTRVKRMSAIYPPSLNQSTMIVIMTNQLMADKQFYDQIQQFLQKKVRIVMLPHAIISDPRIQTVSSRLQLVNNVGKLIGTHNSSLSNTRSLSDMGQSRRNRNIFAYHLSKNKNFNGLMKSLAFKYKGTPVQIIQIRDLNEVRRIIDAQIVLVVCNWQANQFENLVRIVKNDAILIKLIMYVTEGAPYHQHIASIYDYSTGKLADIEYLIDTSLGRVSMSNYRSDDTSINSSQRLSVHRSQQIVTTTTHHPQIQHIQYTVPQQIGIQNNFPQMDPNVSRMTVQTINQPMIQSSVQHPMIQSQFKQQIDSSVSQGTIQSMNAGINGNNSHHQMISSTLPISPVRPLSSGTQSRPFPLTQYYGDQPINNQLMNQQNNIPIRPQSAYLSNYQQNTFINNQSMQEYPMSQTSPRNNRIQMVSAKKLKGQYNSNFAPNIFFVFDKGQNPQYTTFYKSVIAHPNIINQFSPSLLSNVPTIILAPYQYRRMVNNVPQNFSNISFVLYSPNLEPDRIVGSNLIELTTSNSKELENYLRQKNIISSKNYYQKSATSINNHGPLQNPVDQSSMNMGMMNSTLPIQSVSGTQLNPIIIPRMAKISSSIGASARQMQWITNPVGPGEFTTFAYNSTMQPQSVNKNLYQNQTVVPINYYPNQNVQPNLTGVGGVFTSTETYKQHGNVNALDQLSKLMRAGKVPGINFQFNSQITNPSQPSQHEVVLSNQANSQLLNESSQLQEMVISYNQQKTPLIVPSGVQRQNIVKPPSRYQFPMIVDQNNIGTMNMPMEVMPTVPQSRLSNISSQISRRQNGVFNSNINQQSIHYNVPNQYSNSGVNQSGSLQMKTFNTFGPGDVQRQRMMINSNIQTPFHPNQIPYATTPQLRQYILPHNTSQLKNISSQAVPQNIQYSNQQSSYEQQKQQFAQNVMQWRVYRTSINNFVIDPLSHTQTINLPSGQPILIGQQTINQQQFQQKQILNPQQQQISQSPPFVYNPGNNGLPVNNSRMSQLSYQSQNSNQTSINQINVMRSRLGVALQPTEIHHMQKKTITQINYLPPNPNLSKINNNSVQQIHYQNLKGVENQMANTMDGMITDIKRNDYQQDISAKQIGAMIFNNTMSEVNKQKKESQLQQKQTQQHQTLPNQPFMNNIVTNPNVQAVPYPYQNTNINTNINNNFIQQNQVQHVQYTNPNIQQQQSINQKNTFTQNPNQIQTINYQQNINYRNSNVINPQQQQISNPQINQYNQLNKNSMNTQLSLSELNYSNNQIGVKKKVTTVDQGTSPSYDYFPPTKRATSPLRPVKLQQMSIQLSPEKNNRDRFPTVVKTRFSSNGQLSNVTDMKEVTFTQRGNLKIVQNNDVTMPNQYGIVTNVSNRNRINTFDSPSETKRIHMLTTNDYTPSVQSHQQVYSQRIVQSPGRMIDNKLLNSLDFDVRVQNGITIYSRRSNKSLDDNRARSVQYTPSSKTNLQRPSIKFAQAQHTQPQYSTNQNIIVDVRNKVSQDNSISFNIPNQSRQQIIVDLRTQTKGIKSSGYYDSPRVSNAGQTIINGVLSNVHSNGFRGSQKTMRTSGVHQSIKIPYSQKGAGLNIIYPYDQIDIQTGIQKRLKNINQLKYHNKQTLFKYLRQIQGPTILILGIPYDRNIEQVKRLNSSVKIIVFKGNPNLVKIDNRTSVVNSYPQILTYCQKMNINK